MNRSQVVMLILAAAVAASFAFAALTIMAKPERQTFCKATRQAIHCVDIGPH